ncbi:g6790 [Coccomyxa viridis]|uniref:Nuclear pore complex protein Nup85 n=1 Tax=Coccomyxa viridis TaxID=1274662 RepID=A0ABP1FW91_9CHLO
MGEEGTPAVPIPCSRTSRLYLSWGPGTSLLACPAELNASEGSAGPSTSFQTISSIRWGPLPASSRRVAYDSLPAYKALQTSRQQHGAQLATLQQIGEYADSISAVISPQGLAQAEEYGQPQEAATWDFLSLMYVQQQTSQASIAEALVQWMQKHARVLTTPSTSEGEVAGPSLPEEVEELHNAESATSQAKYWPVVHRLVALGWLEDAVGLLGLQPVWWHAHAVDRDEKMQSLVSILEAAVLLLRRMPHYKPPRDTDPSLQTFDDLQVFMDHRRAWQGQVRELLLDQQLWAGAAAANRATAEGVHTLLSILDGSEASLKAAACTWLELMAAQALHKFPGLQSEADLATLVARSMKEKDNGSVELLLVLDGILQAVGQQDLQGLLQTCSASFSRWFMAHLPPLLARHPAAAVLARPLDHFGSDQLEFYTLEYAESLGASQQTWPLAAEYLAWCPVHGRSSLIRLLEGLPLARSSERTVTKALQVCERFRLPEVKVSICQRVGMARLQQGRLACALRWLGSCGSEQALAPLGQQIAARIAEHASELSSRPDELEAMLKDLQFLAAAGEGDAKQHNSVLALIRSYLCLLKAEQQASVEHDSAADSVLRLLSNSMLPESSRLPILYQAVPLLERQQLPPLFSAKDTSKLLAHLQAATAAEDKASQRQDVSAIQLCLARNLARAQIAGAVA